MSSFSKRTLLTAMAALPAAAFLTPGLARADIEVNVNRGDVQPLPIAIPAFTGGQVGSDIVGVISNNLQRSGLFRPLDPASFVERDLTVAVQPRFDARGFLTFASRLSARGPCSPPKTSPIASSSSPREPSPVT